VLDVLDLHAAQRKQFGGFWNREKIEEKLYAPISDKEYHTFVKSFEGINRPGAIRTSLKPEEIVEPIKALVSETRILDFPERCSSPRKRQPRSNRLTSCW
jgi:hypothetical protein